MIEVKENSINLIKQLECCSAICSHAMRTSKNSGVTTYKGRAIVFLTSYPQLIELLLKISFHSNGIQLDHKVLNFEESFQRDLASMGVQVFIATDNVTAISKLCYLDLDYIVVNLMSQFELIYSDHYINLMVRNIKKYNKFAMTYQWKEV